MDCLGENTIVAFFEGLGSRETTARVDEHLASCAACRRLVAEYAAVAPAIGRTLPLGLAPQAGAPDGPPHIDPVLLAASADAARRTVRARARVGTVLGGKYRLDAVLGVGGMAVVYRATHRNEAEFAIKMLHPELGLRPEVYGRFLREGKAANSVKHPGVVRVVDDDVAEDGSAFLVMDLLHGVTVERAWERSGRVLSLACALAIADQLLDALDAAHAKGVVHRDVKPANLFLTRDGSLKVLDFGIARVRDAAAAGPGGETGAGLLLGTPEYMAPEQALGKTGEIDGQTDLWAVGATLFTLVAGRCVHRGDNASQLMVRAATERAPALASLRPATPAAVAEVVDRALGFEKAARWPSAAAMREALRMASRTALGQEPSKASLEALVQATERADACGAEVDLARAPTEPSPPPMRLSPAAAGEGGAPTLASAEKVATGHDERARHAPATSRALRMIAAVALAAAAFAWLGLRAGSGRGEGAPDRPTARSSAPAAGFAPEGSGVPPLPPVPPSAAGSPSAASPASSTTAPSPASSAAASHRSTSPGPARPTPSPRRPGCDPDFVYDANGNKIFKPECFGP